MTVRGAALDAEAVELLADEPELLALADAIAATQPRVRTRRSARRGLAGALAVVAAAAAVVLAVLDGRGERPVVANALAAVGSGPVVHALIVAAIPGTNVVDLRSGRTKRQHVTVEYWFDERRGRLRTVVRHGGVVAAEMLQTRSGSAASRGPVRLAPPAKPALDPALAGFVTRYREALATGVARTAGEGRAAGRDVVWLVFVQGSLRERVAVDRETYEPVVIEPVARDGRPRGMPWRVRLVESVARVEADFTRPRARPPAPFRGDVVASRPLSSHQAVERLRWAPLWLGETWRGLRLVRLEQQTLTRGYPPAARVRVTRGEGLHLRYGIDGEPTYVDVSQAPAAEPAYAFSAAESTFNGNPIPREGSMELVELEDGSGSRAGAVGQLRRNGVYVTIWASSRKLCLAAARALRPIAAGGGGR